MDMDRFSAGDTPSALCPRLRLGSLFCDLVDMVPCFLKGRTAVLLVKRHGTDDFVLSYQPAEFTFQIERLDTVIIAKRSQESAAGCFYREWIGIAQVFIILKEFSKAKLCVRERYIEYLGKPTMRFSRIIVHLVKRGFELPQLLLLAEQGG
jgi:hypothetical protein